MFEIILTCAFFAYGAFTIQRPGFVAHFVTKFWKRYFPKTVHESLYSCGICVCSIWGGGCFLYLIFISRFSGLPYYLLYVPILIIAATGINAIVDRAVKAFEYTYRYNPIIPNSNYSYLENAKYRTTLVLGMIYDSITNSGIVIKVVEIGGVSNEIKEMVGANLYLSYDKANGDRDICDTYLSFPYFIVIQGLAFEGDFNKLLDILDNAKGFVIEGAMSGESKRQLQQIQDRYQLLKIPYKITNMDCENAPGHCGGDVSERVVLAKPV